MDVLSGKKVNSQLIKAAMQRIKEGMFRMVTNLERRAEL